MVDTANHGNTPRAAILDFDGPICGVFAGFKAPHVAQELIRFAATIDINTDIFNNTPDPLEILRLAADNDIDQHRQELLDSELERLEVIAAETASPTPGTGNLLNKLSSTKTPYAVATNNSAAAVTKFFNRMGWTSLPIAGRQPGQTNLLKPNPDSVIKATLMLHATNHNIYFVGDTPTDIHAALACGATPIGYANKPGKEQKLETAGAAQVFNAMAEFTDWFFNH